MDDISDIIRSFNDSKNIDIGKGVVIDIYY